jgi:hypothetical protein
MRLQYQITAGVLQFLRNICGTPVAGMKPGVTTFATTLPCVPASTCSSRCRQYQMLHSLVRAYLHMQCQDGTLSGTETAPSAHQNSAIEGPGGGRGKGTPRVDRTRCCTAYLQLMGLICAAQRSTAKQIRTHDNATKNRGEAGVDRTRHCPDSDRSRGY